MPPTISLPLPLLSSPPFLSAATTLLSRTLSSDSSSTIDINNYTLTATPHGGSGFSSTYKLVASPSSPSDETYFWFVKLGPHGMVRGEFYSLLAIAGRVEGMAPRAYCYGTLNGSEVGEIATERGLEVLGEGDKEEREEGLSKDGHGTVYSPFHPDAGWFLSLPPSEEDPNISGNGGGKSFMITDFIAPLLSRSPPLRSCLLAARLGELHTPLPEDGDKTMAKYKYGFPTTTYCGSTPQDNRPVEGDTWTEFYIQRRLLPIAERCSNSELKKAVHAICEKGGLVERLLGRVDEIAATTSTISTTGSSDCGETITANGNVPVVCHGDLWSGNYMTGYVANGRAGEMVFDPAAVFAPAEYDLGIMHMFGGFSGSFWKEYREMVGVVEPVGEVNRRVELYEL